MDKLNSGTAEKLLKEYFGFKSFRYGQGEIIDAILNGKNVLAILPTGAGKSLCYQIPAMMADSLSIVISPLIALMKDQVDSINSKEEIAAFINSSMDFIESNEVLRKLHSGKIKLLFLSPEKISNKEFADQLKGLSIKYLFIDEAHCISQWGHNFRPSYLKIFEFCEYINAAQIAAFTATATPEVRADIVKSLNLSDPQIFVKGFERDNLYLNVIKTSHKKEKVLELLKTHDTPAIIYGATRKSVEELVDYLRSNNLKAEYYHAGLAPELRRIIQDDFREDRIKIIAATNAFGMGIDKPNIRMVIHINLPGTIENYYQETGRAGRDGKDAYIYLLYDDRDRHIQEFFIESSFPTREQIEIVYNSISDHGRVTLGNLSDRNIEFDTKFMTHLRGNKITGAILDSAVRTLEAAGYIEAISDFQKGSTFRFIISPGELKKYVKRLNNSSLKDTLIFVLREFGSNIFTRDVPIEILKLASKIGIDPASLETDLTRAELLGFARYSKGSQFQSVKLTATRVPAPSLQIDMKNIEEKLANAEAKLDSMIDFANSNECRFNLILNYFGENIVGYECGKCDNCRSDLPQESTSDYLKELIIKTVHLAKNKIVENSIYNVLLGKTVDEELKRLTTFGTCANFNQQDLEPILESLITGKLLTRFENSILLSEDGKNFIAEHEEIPVNQKNETYENKLELFNLLREERKAVSKKFAQNPEMICPDEILKEIAELKPISTSSLLSVKGFTQRMYNKIGDEILSVVKDFLNRQKLRVDISTEKIPHAIANTLKLIEKGYSLKEISSLTKLPEAVVSMQVETIVGYQNDIQTSKLISTETYNLITEKIDEGFFGLRDLKENLPSKVSYAEIRIALAIHKANLKNQF